jgi:hypothetical protein
MKPETSPGAKRLEDKAFTARQVKGHSLENSPSVERVADLAGQSKQGRKARYRFLHGPTNPPANRQSRRALGFGIGRGTVKGNGGVSGRPKKTLVLYSDAPFTLRWLTFSHHVEDLSGLLACWLHKWPA